MSESQKQQAILPLRYRIGALLALVTIASSLVGYWIYQGWQQAAAVQWVRSHGGRVVYDFELDGSEYARLKDGEPACPQWLRELVGKDYVSPVFVVSLENADVRDVSPLLRFTELRSLSLAGTQVDDAAPLRTLTKLRGLNLNGTNVAAATPLANLTELTNLDLSGTQVRDVSPLARLDKLTYLALADLGIDDVRPLANLSSLLILKLDGSQVTDLSPLVTNVDLMWLRVYGTPLSEEQIGAIRTALPNCQVDWSPALAARDG